MLPENTGSLGLHDVALQHGMDAVGRHDEIGLGALAVGEFDDGAIGVLVEAHAPATGGYGARREAVGEHGDEVGPVHPEDPAVHLLLGEHAPAGVAEPPLSPARPVVLQCFCRPRRSSRRMLLAPSATPAPTSPSCRACS